MQIDLDKQIARARVPTPQPIDFVWLADGVKRNNMGLGGFTLHAKAAVRGGKAVLEPTGQSFAADPPADAPAAWRSMRIYDWADPVRIRAAIARS